MGKLLILARYIFLIYGSDIYEVRKHVHCTYAHKGFKRSCKIWLEPEVEIDADKKGDFSEKELNEIRSLVFQQRDLLMKQLTHFYNHETVKAIRL